MPDQERPKNEVLAEMPVQNTLGASPEHIRKERLVKINEEIGSLQVGATSSIGIQQLQTRLEQEYQTELAKLQTGIGSPLSEEAKKQLHANIVGGQMEQAEKDYQRFPGLQTEKRHALLLTANEEGVEMQKYSGQKLFRKDFAGKDRMVELFGTGHTSDRAAADIMYEQLMSSKPDIVMHEGKNVRDLFPNMTDEQIKALDPDTVASMQEQAYIAWKAFTNGVETRSWDLTVAENFGRILQMRDAQGKPKHTPETVQASFAAIAIGKLYGDARDPVKPSAEALAQISSIVLSDTERKSLLDIGLHMDPESLFKSLEKFTGKTTQQLLERFDDPKLRAEDLAMLNSLREPRKSDGQEMGQTNWIQADMNLMRDEHAVDLLNEVKKTHPNIAMIGGGSHVLTWEPAVKDMYTE